jgi:hypothetical protein
MKLVAVVAEVGPTLQNEELRLRKGKAGPKKI